MNLEEKKKHVQILKTRAAAADLECKIMEREEDIIRMKEHLEKQYELVNELQNELKE